jgi:RDD family
VKPVTYLRRLGYGLIDAVVFGLVWLVMVVATNVTPPAMTFMSQYSPEQYRDYIITAGAMTAAMFVMSIVMHGLFGGSTGKLLTGVRTLRADGQSLGWDGSLRRALFCFGVSLLILWPGPITAAIFGERSDAVALALLAVGFALWILCMSAHLVVMEGGARTTLHEKWLGIRSLRIH